VLDHGSCGLLAPLDAPAAWAAELLRLAGDRGLAARLGAAARARVEERYAIERVADQCLDLYARMRRERGQNPSTGASVPVEAA
jgi:glycosyltransferase involved in cell wall biosynthesis